MEANSDLVKVRFDTDPNGLSAGSPERLWARKLLGAPVSFEIQNSPFYAKGVSFLDIVEAIEDPEIPGVFQYRRTLKPSGNSTYRILVDTGSNLFSTYWENLAALGCTYEWADQGTTLLYAVDVPAHADIFKVYSVLEKGEEDEIWDFDEGHCGHSLERRH